MPDKNSQVYQTTYDVIVSSNLFQSMRSQCANLPRLMCKVYHNIYHNSISTMC